MERLKPEKVVEMLRKRGREITVEEAVVILEFLRKLSNIIVSQYLEEQMNIKTVKHENC